MQFSEEETKKLKAMFLFIVKRKHKSSEGKCGFNMKELEPILDELEKEGQIKKRPTINSNAYFLNINK